MRVWLLLLAGLAVSSGVSAATYYVATDGDNNNPGTQSQPFKTVQTAANAVAPGDTVVVKPGDYDEVVNLAKDATQSQPITFRSTGAEVCGFNCRKSDYVIQGFRINGTNSSSSGLIAMVYVYATAHRIRVLDNYFHDSPNLRYAVWLGRGANAVPANSSSYCVISNNFFVAINYINIACNGIGNQFLRNTFKDSNGQADCFRLWGEGHVAADNVITNISALTENHTDFFQVFGPDAPRGTNDYNFVRDIVLERNLVVNSRIQICQLETFQNPTGYMTNLVFRNNIFANLSYAANVDMDGTKWYNNVFYRCNIVNGGHVFAFGGTKGSAYGTEVCNNIFMECGSGSASVGWYPAWGDLQGITNFNLKADYNFVCGPNYAAKAQAPPDSSFRWKSQGQEEHGINGGNPGLVSPSSFNFHLAQDSILINAGATMPGYADDFFGQPRNVGARWDIGAEEYQGGVRPSPPGKPRLAGNP